MTVMDLQTDDGRVTLVLDHVVAVTDAGAVYTTAGETRFSLPDDEVTRLREALDKMSKPTYPVRVP